MCAGVSVCEWVVIVVAAAAAATAVGDGAATTSLVHICGFVCRK